MQRTVSKLTAIAASCALALMPLPVFAVTNVLTADTATDFPGPYRGWLFQGNGLLDTSGFHSDNVIIYSGATCASLPTPCSNSVRVTQAITALGSGLPNTATLASNLAVARVDGVTLALKFTSTGTAAQMVAQANAIKPVLAQFPDVLAVVQFGFRCAFGEWATGCTDNNDLADQTTVRDAVLNMVPTGVPLEFRTPWKMQTWYGATPVTEKQFKANAPGIGRIGLNNDCFLTGQGDSSTYPGAISSTGFSSTMTEAQQRAYAMAVTYYLPFGAEACNNSIGAGIQMRTACSDVLTEGAAYHAGHMNRGFPDNFMAAWSSGGCIDQISRSLGYRIQYDQITYNASAARGTTQQLDLRLRNVGWARPTDQGRVQIIIKPVSGADITNCYSVVQLRELPPQATASARMLINCTIPPGTATGSANVYVKMPNAYEAAQVAAGMTLTQRNNFTKRPANAAANWDATNFRYLVGTMTIT